MGPHNHAKYRSAITNYSVVISEFCTEYDCISAVFCANVENDSTAEMGVLDKRNFVRFD